MITETIFNNESNNKLHIAFIGPQNSGKSTLFNAMIGKDVAIISDKPQTTQRITQTTFDINNIHISLSDTPGISFLHNKDATRKKLNDMSYEAINHNNISFLIVPANKPHINDELLALMPSPKIIITKIDMVKKEKIVEIIDRIHQLYSPEVILCCSGKYNIGVDKVLNYIASIPHRKEEDSDLEKLKKDYELFFSGDISNVKNEFSNEEVVKDIVKEGLFVLLKQELPYVTKIETIEFNETDKSIHCKFNLISHSKSHKNILHTHRFLDDLHKRTKERLKKLVNKMVFVSIKVV